EPARIEDHVVGSLRGLDDDRLRALARVEAGGDAAGAQLDGHPRVAVACDLDGSAPASVRVAGARGYDAVVECGGAVDPLVEEPVEVAALVERLERCLEVGAGDVS